MTKPIFAGIATALITPFKPTGEIDFDAFGRLIDWQIDEGINALVVCGTTGEGPTLTDEEHRACIKYCVERADHRVPVIAGTGSNDIAYSIDLTHFSCKVGADAMLVVTPYYNKATQKGLVTSFKAIADESDKPLILYNVPSRTGCNILPETYAQMAEHPMIQAVKEANGDLSSVLATRALAPGLDIYSGNDDQIVPMLSLGGKGCISVLSNIMPRETVEITRRWFKGDTAGAAELQIRYQPLISALFCEVNPIPVKAAMAKMGFCQNLLRLPLTPMEEPHWQKLQTLMAKEGL